jgi:hypothetical protein
VTGRPRLPGAPPGHPRGIPPIPVVNGEVSVWPWAKSDTVRAGSRRAVHFQVGENPNRVGTEKPIHSGVVRVGFLDDDQAPENFTGYVVLPDNGIRIGPIDLPFELAVPLPMRVEVQPDVEVAADRHVICTLAWPPVPVRWQATRWETIPAFDVPAQHIVIPQWVHSLSCYQQDAAVSMFDVTGALLDAITAPFYDVPRPRRAVLLATTSETDVPVLYSYQA